LLLSKPKHLDTPTLELLLEKAESLGPCRCFTRYFRRSDPSTAGQSYTQTGTYLAAKSGILLGLSAPQAVVKVQCDQAIPPLRPMRPKQQQKSR
jgi:hypothetical protein